MLTHIASDYELSEKYSAIIVEQNPILIGFDTETTIWRIEEPHYTSTVQLYLNSNCYIFQLYRIFKIHNKLPKDLIKILQNPNIIKIGTDLTNDTTSLLSYSIILRGTIDIQCIAKTMQIPDVSLEGLASKFEVGAKGLFSFKWDWDAQYLNEEQIEYAATDAMLPLKIYEKMITGVIVSDNIAVDESIKQEEEYLEWLRSMGHTSTLKIKKVVNQTINSYGPWRKRYTESERSALALKLIRQFLDEGLL